MALCAKFGKECRNTFTVKTTIVEPETSRTMREEKFALISKENCDDPKNITEDPNKTSQAQNISPTHPEKVDKFTFDV